MISAFKPFFSKKPFSCAINTGYETVGNRGTPMRILSWPYPTSAVKNLITIIENKKVRNFPLCMMPPYRPDQSRVDVWSGLCFEPSHDNAALTRSGVKG